MNITLTNTTASTNSAGLTQVIGDWRTQRVILVHYNGVRLDTVNEAIEGGIFNLNRSLWSFIGEEV